MLNYRHNPTLLTERLYVCYTGMDTDILYNRGIDLPGFASYPLLSNPKHKQILKEYYSRLVELARQQNIAVILDSVTWAANRDRGAALGYTADELKQYNIDAMQLIANVREQHGDLPTILSAQVGPRDDGYAPSTLMTIEQAEKYHREQIEVYSATQADIISAFTICYVEEAAGIVLAAQHFKMPVAISFTVEIDGKLPTGMLLSEAIELVDKLTNQGPLYYLINCAHPEHCESIFEGKPCLQRLRGVVANASRCSHQQLEVASELDNGDPQELGEQLGKLRTTQKHFNIMGGCCGTDFRHLKHIIEQCKK